MPRRDLRLGLCLVVLAVVPYLNALPAGFTFDDEGVIVTNPPIRSAQPPLRALFARPYEPGSLYRPVTFLTFWLNRRVDEGALGFHAVNVGLHALVTLLVFALARRLLATRESRRSAVGSGQSAVESWRSAVGSGPSAAAFFAAALFAVHPVHTEAVTSVVGRAELLAAAAVLGALLCVQQGRERRGRVPWRAVAVGLFAAGLLCKESAFVLLPLLVVIAAGTEGTSLPVAAVRIARRPEGWAIGSVMAAYLGLRLLVIGSLQLPVKPEWIDNPLAHTGVSIRLATAAAVLLDYVSLLLAPVALSADYSYDAVPLVTSLRDVRLLAVGLFALSAGLALQRLRRTLPLAGIAAAFFFAALALTANVLMPIGTIKAERLLYLPSVGFCILGGVIYHLAVRRRPQATIAVALLIVALFAGRTWARNADWESNLTLFHATVATVPQSAKAYHNLGVALDQVNDLEGAGLAFRRSLQLYPQYADAAFGIGRTYERRGMARLALHWYGQTLAREPEHVKAHLNRATVLYNQGHFAEAEEGFLDGLAIAPEHPRLLTGLGLSRLGLGRVDEATAVLERAAALDTTDAEAQRALQLARATSAGAS